MQLDQYLFENNITGQDFAKLINYNKNTIYRYLKGFIEPSVKFAKAIEKATAGQVKIAEVFTYQPKKKKTGDVAPEKKEKQYAKKRIASDGIFCKHCMKKLNLIFQVGNVKT